MNARLPGQILYDLDLDDEEEDVLAVRIREAQTRIAGIAEAAAQHDYERICELANEAGADLRQAHEQALMRWMAQP